jgi:hypothetical protein
MTEQEYNGQLAVAVTDGLGHLSMAWQNRMSNAELGAIGLAIKAITRAAAEDR